MPLQKVFLLLRAAIHSIYLFPFEGFLQLMHSDASSQIVQNENSDRVKVKCKDGMTVAFPAALLLPRRTGVPMATSPGKRIKYFQVQLDFHGMCKKVLAPLTLALCK